MIAKFSTPCEVFANQHSYFTTEDTEWIKPLKSVNNLGICQYIILYTFLFFMLIIFLC